jgi:predicted MFS family arabinose efflux permease
MNDRSSPDSSPNPADSSPVQVDGSLLTIFGVTLIAVLGVASIAPALPTIAQELGISTQRVGMLITVFTLPGVFLAPLFGFLADRFGRKTVLAPALLLFACAGAACAGASDFRTLLVWRLVQGIGAAPLGSINITLVGDLYEGRRRMTAMGYNASVLSVGTASYPLLGGALAALAWRAPFLISLAALPVAAFVLWVLRNPEVPRRAGLAAYARDVRAAFHRRLIVLVVASMLTFIMLYGVILTYLPFLMNSRFESSTAAIGAMLSTMSVTTGVTSSQLGRVTARFGAGRVLLAAMVLYTISLLSMLVVRSVAALLIPVALFGAANGLNIPTLQGLVAGEVGPHVRAVVMSLNATALRLGQTLGPATMGLAYAWGGLDLVLWTGAGCAGILFLLALLWLQSSPSN